MFLLLHLNAEPEHQFGRAGVAGHGHPDHALLEPTSVNTAGFALILMYKKEKAAIGCCCVEAEL